MSNYSTIPKNPINIIGILKPQTKINYLLHFFILLHIVLEPDFNSLNYIKKLEKEEFKSDSIRLFDNYKKVKDIIEKKYQKENFWNLNDISKIINFVYRFTEEEIISDLKQELQLQSIDMKLTLIYDIPIGTLTYKIREKNKIQIKNLF